MTQGTRSISNKSITFHMSVLKSKDHSPGELSYLIQGITSTMSIKDYGHVDFGKEAEIRRNIELNNGARNLHIKSFKLRH